jgi:zinc protease
LILLEEYCQTYRHANIKAPTTGAKPLLASNFPLNYSFLIIGAKVLIHAHFWKDSMQILTLLVSLLVAGSTFANPSTSHSIPGFPDIQTQILPNGLKVVVWPDPAAKQASINIWYRVGSLHERPGITGIAHIFEHMTLRPSKFAPQGALAFERTMGADTNAHTRFKTTDYYATLPPEKIEHMITYYADTMSNMPVDSAMLKNEKEAIRSEYLNWDNSPFLVMLPVLTKHAYPGHIAENFITGARPDLDRISAKDCMTFYKSYYAPNNAVLVVTGKVEPASIFKMSEQYFGPIRKGTDAILPSDLKTLPPEKTVNQPVPGNLYPLVLTFPLPFAALPPEEDTALKLAFEMAFGGKTSIVGDRLINKEKLASGVGFDDIGLGFYFAQISLIANKGQDALKIVDESLEKLGSVDDRTLARYASSSQADLLRALQTPTQRAKILGYYLTHKNGVETLITDLTMETSVNLQRFKQTVAKYLSPKNRIAVIGIPSGEKS